MPEITIHDPVVEATNWHAQLVEQYQKQLEQNLHNLNTLQRIITPEHRWDKIAGLVVVTDTSIAYHYVFGAYEQSIEVVKEFRHYIPNSIVDLIDILAMYLDKRKEQPFSVIPVPPPSPVHIEIDKSIYRFGGHKQLSSEDTNQIIEICRKIKDVKETLRDKLPLGTISIQVGVEIMYPQYHVVMITTWTRKGKDYQSQHGTIRNFIMANTCTIVEDVERIFKETIDSLTKQYERDQ